VIRNLLDRLTGAAGARKAGEMALELRDAQRMDANRARIAAQDPHVDQIFTVGFVQVHHDPSLNFVLAEQLKAYEGIKHAAGRLDLYRALFAGLEGTS
jgi:hypothetical protein